MRRSILPQSNGLFVRETRLLRPRGERPRRRRADEMSDKFTPSHIRHAAYSPSCASAVAADSQDLLAISQLLCRAYSILLQQMIMWRQRLPPPGQPITVRTRTGSMPSSCA